MHTPSRKAYKFATRLEPGGHDVYSCKLEGGQSKWGVRQDPPAKRAARRNLKKRNNAAIDKFERKAEA